MLQILPGFPDTVLAVSASGDVTAEDYRIVLVPAVTRRLTAHPHIDLYYRLGPDFTGMSAGAMWEDAKLGIAHWTGWGRIAVVTDIAWIANAVRLFAPLFHRPVRIFSNDQAEAAREWLAHEEATPA